MPETPEQKARLEIDEALAAAGWLVQSRDQLDLTASRGIAVREFPMKTGFGFADYLPLLAHVRTAIRKRTNFLPSSSAPLQATGLAEAEEPVKGLRIRFDERAPNARP